MTKAASPRRASGVDTSRGNARRARRVAGAPRHRSRRPVARAHVERRPPARGDVVGAGLRAVATGRTRYVGVSNFAGWQTARAATWQRPGRAGPGSPPRWSTRCCSAGSSASASGRRRSGRPAGLVAGAGGQRSAGSTATASRDSRAASPHLGGFVGRYLDHRSRRIVDAVVTAADGLGATPRRWRSRGYGTGPGSPRPGRSAYGGPAEGALERGRDSSCRRRSRRRWRMCRPSSSTIPSAEDDVSSAVLVILDLSAAEGIRSRCSSSK